MIAANIRFLCRSIIAIIIVLIVLPDSNDAHTIAHWRFNEGTGTALTDLSGNGHHGTLVGALRTDSGIVFDGIDDYVAVPDDSTFELADDWTIDYTISFDNAVTPVNNIVFARTIDGLADYAVGSARPTTATGHTELYRQWSSSDTMHYRPYGDVPATGLLHVTIVKVGARIYVLHNDRLVATTLSAKASPSGKGLLRIGAWGGASEYLIGNWFARMRLIDLAVSDSGAVPQAVNRVNGLVARWTFDDRADETLNDVSGNGHNGRIMKGTALSDGLFGQSYTFTDSSYVTVDRHPHFNSDSALTITGWVRPYSTSGTGVIIDRSGSWGGFRVTLESQTLVLRSGGQIVLAGSKLAIDRWYQFAYTFNNGKVAFYLDGALIASTQKKETSLGFCDTIVSIGREALKPASLNFLRGSLDELALYDVALTADSIKALYTKAISAAASDTSGPFLIIKSPAYGKIQQGLAYTEYGAQAWDGKDGEITSLIVVDNKIDNNVPGAYEVCYTATNSIGKSSSVKRIVTVVADTQPPVLTLKGATDIQILVNHPFVEPGYTATDYPTPIQLTDSVKVTSTLDTTKTGIYTITYTVTDAAGLTTTATRKIAVKDLFRIDAIRCNQLGFQPSQQKIACIAGSLSDTFEILVDNTDSVVFTGVLSDSVKNGSVNEYIRVADFSALTTEGTYQLRARRYGYSYPFCIAKEIYSGVARAALKSYYYQRCSVPLDIKYAGAYARPAGHPDTACPLYADSKRKLNVTGGWYDAGDYGKYIVNGGITVGTLLSLYELIPGCFGDSLLAIPESGNGRDDLLDEVKWELDWFKTMQDTSGGVYFKVGPSSWPDFIMPTTDTRTRYVYDMSTTSALNFAAVMAQAGRIFRAVDSTYAEDCLQRAERAWEWAKNNPAVRYPSNGSGTGLYDDTIFGDEILWAATELYITTGKDAYRSPLDSSFKFLCTQPAAWNNVRNLPLHSLCLQHLRKENTVTVRAVDEVVRFADAVLERVNSSAARIPMDSTDYIWGSNGITGNYAVSLGFAYAVTKERKYLDGVLATLDYLLGKNPLCRSFVTGYGSRPPLHPHHRISGADNIVAPVPGFVVGGPNGGREDGLSYPNSNPALCYLDTMPSYASNEVAINWNAPFVFAAVLANHEFTNDIPVGSMAGSPSAGPVHLRILSGPAAVQLELRCSGKEMVGWMLIDMLGRCAGISPVYTLSAGTHMVTVPLDRVGNGVYLLKVTAGNTTLLRKVQVIR